MNECIVFEPERCVGCGACMVACMDQNDTLYDREDTSTPHRRVGRLERGVFPAAVIRYISVGCMHCADPACVIGCPTGALLAGVDGAVVVRRELCIGCHSCAMACPFGVPRYDGENKVTKCDRCSGRTQAGLLPACVRICQAGALRFEDPNCLQSEKETRLYEAVLYSGTGRWG